MVEKLRFLLKKLKFTEAEYNRQVDKANRFDRISSYIHIEVVPNIIYSEPKLVSFTESIDTTLYVNLKSIVKECYEHLGLSIDDDLLNGLVVKTIE